MVRTQVQLPTDLDQAAKPLAEEWEIMLVEVVRPGLEHILRIYPPRGTAGGWQLPEPHRLGTFRALAEEWREGANE